MFPGVRGKCEDFYYSPQISTAVTRNGRLLTRYAPNSLSNGAAMSGWRKISEREFGDQGVEKVS